MTMDAPKLSILIPVCNEELLLESTAKRLEGYLATRASFELVVVNNGSTDQTEQIGSRLAATYPWFRFFTQSEKGPGRAFVRAVQESSGEYLISLDADLSGELCFIDYSLDLLRHSDMLVGSKSMGKQQRSFVRVVASQVYILFTQLLFGLTISDYSIGSKAFRRASVIDLLDGLDPWTGYVLELVLRLERSGRRVIQIGIDCVDDRESRFNLLHEGLYRYRHLFQLWRRLRKAA